jgi:hypothetical protein
MYLSYQTDFYLFLILSCPSFFFLQKKYQYLLLHFSKFGTIEVENSTVFIDTIRKGY